MDCKKTYNNLKKSLRVSMLKEKSKNRAFIMRFCVHLIKEVIEIQKKIVSFYTCNKLLKDMEIKDQKLIVKEEQNFLIRPKISIIVPLFNPIVSQLEQMLDSVLLQVYKNWELILIDTNCINLEIIDIKKTNQIKYKKIKENGGIAENTNLGVSISTGDYIAFLDQDDLLHPEALHQIVKEINQKNPDFIYTDEAIFSGKSVIAYHFKPDIAPDYLRSNNYICHLSVVKKEIYILLGGLRKEYDGAQDHDFILRILQNNYSISHIPKILYFWRRHKNSTSIAKENQMLISYRATKAIKKHLLDIGQDGEVLLSKEKYPYFYRIKYNIIKKEFVSIIIPNRDHIDLLSNCINSIYTNTQYSNFEIIIVENNSKSKKTQEFYNHLKKRHTNITILNYGQYSFNYSAINNFGANFAKGEQLIFLNNDIEIITNNWINELLMYSQRKDVGAVGAKLYYKNNTIQHAGVILKLGRDRIAGHISLGTPRDSAGYMGRLIVTQNFMAVTSALMMVRRDVFNEVGQFNLSFSSSYSDLDLCLRIKQRGYNIVWTPFCEAYHFESETRGYKNEENRLIFDSDINNFKKHWKDLLSQEDPYFNPNFSLNSPFYSLKK